MNVPRRRLTTCNHWTVGLSLSPGHNCPGTPHMYVCTEGSSWSLPTSSTHLSKTPLCASCPPVPSTDRPLIIHPQRYQPYSVHKVHTVHHATMQVRKPRTESLASQFKPPSLSTQWPPLPANSLTIMMHPQPVYLSYHVIEANLHTHIPICISHMYRPRRARAAETVALRHIP